MQASTLFNYKFSIFNFGWYILPKIKIPISFNENESLILRHE